MNILEEADSLINGQRAKDYGPVSENFERIAGMWGSYLGINLRAFDVSNLMILVKVSRLENGYHRDSYADIAGYAALAEQIDAEYQEEFSDEESLEIVELDVPEDDRFFIEHMTQPATPRVWENLHSDVPVGVTVTDIHGDTWKWAGVRGWQCWIDGSPDDHIQDPERYSPFTEVLEDL